MAELLSSLLLRQRLGGIFLPEQTIQWNFQTSHQEGQSVGGSCSEKRSVSFYLTRFPFPKKPVQISQFWGKENSYYPQTYGSFIFARQPQIPSCVTSHKEMVPLCMLLPNPVRVVCVCACLYMQAPVSNKIWLSKETFLFLPFSSSDQQSKIIHSCNLKW